jgi:signal transduction histidine kinase
VVVALGAGCADAYASADRTGPLALNIALVAGMSLALLWRRRAPLAFLIAVNLLALPISDGLTSINNPTLVSTYVFAVPVWAVAVWSSSWTAICGLVLTAGFDIGEGLYWHLGGLSIVSNVLIAGVLWIAGRVLRAQRLMAADLRRTSALLEVEQQAHEALILAEERTRLIARLHARVAEEVSAMIVAAESVRDLVGIDADAAVGSIGEIERTGRQSLTQLREILGVLRSEYDPDPLPS